MMNGCGMGRQMDDSGGKNLNLPACVPGHHAPSPSRIRPTPSWIRGTQLSKFYKCLGSTKCLVLRMWMEWEALGREIMFFNLALKIIVLSMPSCFLSCLHLYIRQALDMGGSFRQFCCWPPGWECPVVCQVMGNQPSHALPRSLPSNEDLMRWKGS